ncbi:unnamed protein product [Onchocerca flexuosa]|uniref:WD_REPEATS_REGION domain-containing protein n=1 Tax=Onchocerca flexuosa TaxID=387005 RepID=A0A183H0Q1_9BILA|nr:unnamed protein product [Onchocerca flexuosa]
MKGHQNERNFVGLATDGNHIVCGSENNHLYLYHKGLCDPLMCYDFGRADSTRSALLATDSPSDFVSAVSWKKVYICHHIILYQYINQKTHL